MELIGFGDEDEYDSEHAWMMILLRSSEVLIGYERAVAYGMGKLVDRTVHGGTIHIYRTRGSANPM